MCMYVFIKNDFDNLLLDSHRALKQSDIKHIFDVVTRHRKIKGFNTINQPNALMGTIVN